MTINEYQQLAQRTANTNQEAIEMMIRADEGRNNNGSQD